MLYINLTILKCSYQIDIIYSLSHVLRFVLASFLRMALSSRLALSLKLILLVRVFGVGGILPEPSW